MATKKRSETVQLQRKGQSEEGDAGVQASRVAVGQKRKEGYKSEAGDRYRIERGARGGSQDSEEGRDKETSQRQEELVAQERIKVEQEP